MKKLFAIVLCLTLALSLCACGVTKPTAGSGSGKTEKETTTTIAKDSDGNSDNDSDKNSDGNNDKESDKNSAGNTDKESDKNSAGNTDKESDKNSAGNTDKDSNKESDKDSNKESVVNEFYKPNNNYYDEGAVSVRPGYVYWEGDTLVAECFVINGVNRPVSSITIEELSLSNDAGLIADGAFGELQGLTLNPYTHYVWTFRFSADCIAQMNGDLTTLECHSAVSFRY